ncbi:MAG: OmpA family protein [Alphaproteobacteria bacterium]|nr:OmpA family protein [Alphaproteobacteria bacterium]
MSNPMRDIKPSLNRHSLPHFWRLSGGTAALAALMFSTMLSSAQAQQAYFRGEANNNDSVIVNLSVINKLTGGPAPLQTPSFATPAAPPVSTLTAPTQPAPAKPMPAKPQPSTSAGLAPPPSQPPQSTLLVPAAPTASSGAAVAATPPPVPSLPLPTPAKPAAKPAPPPPKPQLAAEPAPKPAAPKPAPSKAPASTLETTQTATAIEPPPVPKPAPAATPSPAPMTPPPAPSITPQPAPTETAQSETPQVASVNLRNTDSSGVMRNDDGLSVLFSRDSQDLPDAAENALEELAKTLKGNETLTLKLLGYSEPIGEAQSKPRRLSLFRALAVRTYLLKQGIDSRRMTVQALGTKDDTPDRPKNRVDLIVSGA